MNAQDLNLIQERKPDFLVSKDWINVFNNGKVTDHQARILVKAIFALNCDGALSADLQAELDANPICDFFFNTEVLPYTTKKLSEYVAVVNQKRAAAGIRWNKQGSEEPDTAN